MDSTGIVSVTERSTVNEETIMTRFETTVLVPEDRRVVLQVPDDVSPGKHRVRIQIDPVENSSPIDLVARGIAERQAADLRHRLGTIAEDWNRPDAGVYDEP